MTRLPLALVLALLVMACSDDPSGPSAPAYVGMTVDPVPANGLARIVTIRGSGWDSIGVRVLDPAGLLLMRAPAAPPAGDSIAEIAVLGLLPDSVFRLTADLWKDGVSRPGRDTFNFLTAPLPDWIPAVGTLGTQGAPGLTSISLPDGGVIVDEEGRVRWYRHAPNGALNSLQAHANGRYTLLSLDEVDEGFMVLDRAGRLVDSLTCNGWPTRFHDVRIESDGSAWILCDDLRTMDLSGVGGMAGAMVTGTVLQHLSPAGAVLFEWNAFDHFAITDLPEAFRTGPAVNFTHGNSITIDTDGNPIVSFRSLNEVTKIDRATGAVLWRFGGLGTDFTLVDDPKGGFERQHGARVAGPGQLQFLDNGDAAPSRLVRYLLDPATGLATLTWAFTDAPETWTNIGGSTVVLPDGGALVSFGLEGRVVEVDAAGLRRWELTGLDGRYVFRSERLGSSLY